MGGPLTYEEIQEAIRGRKHKNIKNFVETGTYKGDTTMLAATHYEKVYTTEICYERYEQSKKRAEDASLSNIDFLFGDSIELLEFIAPKVNEGAVFFIDAHISGSDSSWNGKERVPLMKELQVILKHNIGPSVFIIDDVRFWKGKEQEAWDWCEISAEKIVKLFIDNGYELASFYESNDRFFVLTN